jgi:2-keto-3-deoxy-L-rhamnonate aldolase RhmA
MSTEIPAWLEAAAVNGVMQRLKQGLPVAALGIRSSRTVEIVRIAKATGHHCIWVDLEHSPMPIDIAASLCATALDIGLTPLVRIPERGYGVIGRLLDGGALGIIAPRIETAAQAADVVKACRFPPLGARSALNSLPQLGMRRVDAAPMNAAMNRATLVKILVETQVGIDNLDDIAALPGVDLIAIGTNDLTAEFGVPGDFRHPTVRAAHEHALAVCKRHHKPLVIGGIGDSAYTAELIRMGAAPFLFTGIDTELMLSIAGTRVQATLASLQA